jgi:hypothetical protein
MHAHGVPVFLVAAALTALIIALVIFYACHDWSLVAVSLFLLMVLVLSLRITWLIDSFRRRRPKSRAREKGGGKTSALPTILTFHGVTMHNLGLPQD